MRSVRTTLRRPPVAEYASVTATIATIESAFCVERSQPGSGAPPWTSGTPIHSTTTRAASKTPAGSHSAQRRSGSVTASAAKSTIASTTQLKTVPK